MPDANANCEALRMWDRASAAMNLDERTKGLISAFIEMSYQEGVVNGITACGERLERVFSTVKGLAEELTPAVGAASGEIFENYPAL